MKIARENRRMELELKRETQRAAYGAKRQRAEQKLKKRRGQISGDAQDTSTNYMRGPLNQNDPKDKNKTTMDFNVGSGLVEGKGGRRKQFEKAFATARKAGVKEFTYNVGEEPKKKYTTKLKKK